MAKKFKCEKCGKFKEGYCVIGIWSDYQILEHKGGKIRFLSGSEPTEIKLKKEAEELSKTENLNSNDKGWSLYPEEIMKNKQICLDCAKEIKELFTEPDKSLYYGEELEKIS